MLENAHQCLSDFQFMDRDPLKKQIFFMLRHLMGSPNISNVDLGASG